MLHGWPTASARPGACWRRKTGCRKAIGRFSGVGQPFPPRPVPCVLGSLGVCPDSKPHMQGLGATCAVMPMVWRALFSFSETTRSLRGPRKAPGRVFGARLAPRHTPTQENAATARLCGLDDGCWSGEGVKGAIGGRMRSAAAKRRAPNGRGSRAKPSPLTPSERPQPRPGDGEPGEARRPQPLSPSAARRGEVQEPEAGSCPSPVGARRAAFRLSQWLKGETAVAWAFLKNLRAYERRRRTCQG